MNVMVVSGPYGIDTCAPHLCENDVPTVGVLAHGLDKLYPPDNAALVKNDSQRQHNYRICHWDKTCSGFFERNRIVAEWLVRGGDRIKKGGGSHNRRHSQLLQPRCVCLTRKNKRSGFRRIKINKVALIESKRHCVHAWMGR